MDGLLAVKQLFPDNFNVFGGSPRFNLNEIYLYLYLSIYLKIDFLLGDIASVKMTRCCTLV